MLKPEFTGQFKKDYKRAVKRGCKPEKLEEVITLLCEEKPLPEKFRDHQLQNSKRLQTREAGRGNHSFMRRETSSREIQGSPIAEFTELQRHEGMPYRAGLDSDLQD